jgi:hypothetical protein
MYLTGSAGSSGSAEPDRGFTAVVDDGPVISI